MASDFVARGCESLSDFDFSFFGRNFSRVCSCSCGGYGFDSFGGFGFLICFCDVCDSGCV